MRESYLPKYSSVTPPVTIFFTLGILPRAAEFKLGGGEEGTAQDELQSLTSWEKSELKNLLRHYL
jgi:hypothetical protein